MRRLIAVLVLLAATLVTSTPAHGYWGHRWGWRLHWGHHHRGWGYNRWAWGGYGYRGGWGGYGYRGGYPWGGYRSYGYPFYGGGYYPYYPAYSYPIYSPWYGCYNYGYGAGTTVGLGYPAYGLYGATYGPTSNQIVQSVRPSTTPSPVQAAPAPGAFRDAAPTALMVQQFLGLRGIQPIALNVKPNAGGAVATVSLKTLDDVLTRVSDIGTRRKAERLLKEGDELFRVQNFHSALQKYKLAAVTAPSFAETHWRKGHALVATHNYELAPAAFKRAIALTEELGRDGFRLTDLYGGAAMTKTQHLESLAEWAASRGRSPDPYFLLGLFLNYDGQAARAERFFQKASDLAGISGGHIAVFLDPPVDANDGLPSRAVGSAVSAPVIPVSAGTDI